MVKHYDLKPGAKILDVGCGKAFLLYEFTQVLSDCEVFGIDISKYGVENAKEEVRDRLRVGNASNLPYDTDQFDFVYSINTLHNLDLPDLWASLEEIERVGKGAKKHITIEAYRNERERRTLCTGSSAARSTAGGVGVALRQDGLLRRLRLHYLRVGASA